MGSHKRIVVCDPDAFYPFRGLVGGPLTKPDQLEKIEGLLRAVVLHDEIAMDLEPHTYDPEIDEEWSKEEIAAGGKNVLVAFGPMTEKYGLFFEDYRKKGIPRVKVPPALLEVISNYSNAGEGNVYYKAHVEYLQPLKACCFARCGRLPFAAGGRFSSVCRGAAKSTANKDFLGAE